MKQSSAPYLPPPSSSQNNNEEVTEKEMIYHLENKSSGTVLLLEDKKDFLCKIHSNYKKCLHQAELFNASLGTSLETAFQNLIPKQQVTISCTKNNELGTIITKLLTPLNIVSQFEAENCKKPHLCSSSTSKRVIDNPAIDLLDQSHVILENIGKKYSPKG